MLQDDVRLCRNFPPAVERIAQANPETPVCLFVGGLPRATARDLLQAGKQGKHYARVHITDFVPVVAMLWPVQKAAEFLEWALTAKLPGLPNPRSDDAVVGGWARQTRETVLATFPSLVEHPDVVESLIGREHRAGQNKGRVALAWIGEGDPLQIPW